MYFPCICFLHILYFGYENSYSRSQTWNAKILFNLFLSLMMFLAYFSITNVYFLQNMVYVVVSLTEAFFQKTQV